jgi:crotonobetainyl-CoA:carnitine CoA-transferase CaiB-like acyl-CoA transferase
MRNAIAGGALQGLRIVDLSRVLAGPLCTQILGDHGAEVIKVEPPEGDETRRLGPPFDADGASAYYLGLNRNKRAIALDLRSPTGREVLLRLLEGADVLVENFLPGTMERWGLGYERDLAPRLPRLVYCAISGFGGDGPHGGLPGYDAVLQALCGLMSVNGFAQSGPTRIGIPVVDLATGLHAVIAILLALAERARSGRGQRTEATLFDTAYSLLHPHAANYLVSGAEPALTGNAHPNISPYDTYPAADGSFFLGVVNDAQFGRFCEAVGAPLLAADPRFGSNALRLANRAALRRAIEAAVAREPVEALCERLMAAGVPAAPVRSVPQALADPHALHRGALVALGAYRGVGAAQKLARTPASLRSTPPAFAADTQSLLSETGYSRSEIEALVREGVAPLEPRGPRKASPQKEVQ